jgi:hypothetical protein
MEGVHYENYREETCLILLLLVISFFNPSAPFPPKARGRRGFDFGDRTLGGSGVRVAAHAAHCVGGVDG